MASFIPKKFNIEELLTARQNPQAIMGKVTGICHFFVQDRVGKRSGHRQERGIFPSQSLKSSLVKSWSLCCALLGEPSGQFRGAAGYKVFPTTSPQLQTRVCPFWNAK